MNDPNIVILAGGVSSRMRNIPSASAGLDPILLKETLQKSKSMLSVGRGTRPFMDYILYNIREARYKNVVIVVGDKDTSIRDYYNLHGGAKQFSELNIDYVTQIIPDGRTKPLGTADALLTVLQSKPGWRGKSFTVCNSDNIYSVNALRLLLLDAHKNSMIDYDRSGLQFDHSRIEAFAILQKDQKGFLLDLIEKPNAADITQIKDDVGRIGVSMNIFKLSYDMIFPYLNAIPLHPMRDEKELPLAVKTMVEKCPKCMMTIPLSEHVIDLTHQSDINQVKEYLEKEFPNL